MSEIKQSPTQEMAQMIIAVVAAIPYAKVATYGQVAKMAGLPRHARMVGRVLAQLDADSTVPWHRVINAQAKLSLNKLDANGENIQQLKLMQEGIAVVAAKVDLKRFAWVP